ncbi:enoyl-CoA hydratase-related protein [Marinospirillum sp.]|uniref:enoyl-CoA hydratase-related protein n=1 Tax=Marinospirillum sp. TaxID=2183934 RepID=UPI002870724C|nr:enoyl-CoA hydratase-related protein [Marinospirillum sp.]MDR9467876.1 enoyl-CoA hydratase-related protein [Marinospirillum sp.]
MNAEQDLVEVKLEAGVLYLTLNRQEKCNAINASMYATLAWQLQLANTNPSVRVVVITGKGSFFTAGNDLDAFEARPQPGTGSPALNFIHQLTCLEKPLVAAVQGMAIGIGVTLLLHCDLVYASDKARFRMPFVNLGVIPEAGSTVLLPERLGYLQAFECLALGDFFDADQALTRGLINQVFSEESLDEQVKSIVKRVAEQPAEALQTTKKLLRKPAKEGLQARISEEIRIFRQLLDSPDSKAARRALRRS